MTVALHPAASHNLPMFITAPDGTDVLMVIMAVFLICAVVGFGLLFLHLHTLPERIAHKSHKIQFEVVAVLGLLALFTHQHIFWVIGLMLALIEVPDFGGWLGRITRGVERMAGIKSPPDEVEAPEEQAAAAPEPASDAAAPHEASARATERKEMIHA